MISIVIMNMNVSNSSFELTMTQTTKQHVQTVADMLSYDIPKIGYARQGKVSKYPDPSNGGNPYSFIETAASNKITFNSDIDNSGTIDTITWELTSDEVSSTSNPSDFILVRNVNGDITEIKNGVSKFSINYYDRFGENKTDKMTTPVTGSALNDIVQIEIELVIESSETINYSFFSDGRYVRSSWDKRFTPVNLN